MKKLTYWVGSGLLLLILGLTNCAVGSTTQAREKENLDPEVVAGWLTDINIVLRGQAVYGQACASCHGGSGEGSTAGPNLIDYYWLHNNRFKDILHFTMVGSKDHRQHNFRNSLSGQMLRDVSIYVMTLEGSEAVAEAQGPAGTLQLPSYTYYQKPGRKRTKVKMSNSHKPAQVLSKRTRPKPYASPATSVPTANQ